jgi:lysophospholipase L1-like esterase
MDIRTQARAEKTPMGWQPVFLTDPRLAWAGRITGTLPMFSWTGTQLRLRFRGRGVRFVLESQGDSHMQEADRNFYELNVDHRDSSSHAISKSEREIEVDSLLTGEHEVVLEKVTEALCGRDRLVRIEILDGELLQAAPTTRRILFLGNSITAGYGIEDNDPMSHFRPETQNGSVTYAGVAAGLLNASRTQVCISGRGLVRNFDGTKNDILPKFLDWSSPQDPKPWPVEERSDVVVVEIGTNDFSMGDPGELTFVLACQHLVRTLMAKYPNAHLVLIDSPMLTDEYPVNPRTRQPVPSHSLLRAYLAQVRRGLAATERPRLSVCQLTPQGADIYGYGADYHPNREQASLNGKELEEHIRTVMKW